MFYKKNLAAAWSRSNCDVYACFSETHQCHENEQMCFFSSYIYIYYHRYIIKQLLHYIWILFTHIYLKTKQILVNKIQYSDQLYIILVITLSYLQIPLKTSLISIRSEYLNTSIKHWWTLNMVKTWVAIVYFWNNIDSLFWLYFLVLTHIKTDIFRFVCIAKRF